MADQEGERKIFSAGPLPQTEIKRSVEALPEEKKGEFKSIVEKALSGGFNLMAVEQGLREVEEKARETTDPFHVGYFYRSELLIDAAEKIYEGQQAKPQTVEKAAHLIDAYLTIAQSQAEIHGEQNRESVYLQHQKQLVDTAFIYLSQK